MGHPSPRPKRSSCGGRPWTSSMTSQLHMQTFLFSFKTSYVPITKFMYSIRIYMKNYTHIEYESVENKLARSGSLQSFPRQKHGESRTADDPHFAESSSPLGPSPLTEPVGGATVQLRGNKRPEKTSQNARANGLSVTDTKGEMGQNCSLSCC